LARHVLTKRERESERRENQEYEPGSNLVRKSVVSYKVDLVLLHKRVGDNPRSVFGDLYEKKSRDEGGTRKKKQKKK
jgi:hypothetical protein